MNRILWSSAAVALVIGGLVGCGGGGGGGGGPSGFSYSGNTSQAQLHKTNSKDFVEVVDSGTTGGDSLAVRSGDSTAAGPASDLGLVTLGLALRDSITRSGSGSGFGSPITSAIESASETAAGACGGQVTIDITFDDQSGEFNGNIVYRQFDDCEVLIDGSAGFSGVINLAADEFQAFTLTITLLSISSGGETLDLSGSVSIDLLSTTSAAVTYDLAFRTGGETFRLANFTISIDELTSPASVTFSGRIFHPEHGFVDVVTNVPVQTTLGNENPTSGEIVFTGSGGTTATVTFNSVDDYTIEVDSDGDGGVDTILACTWSPDACA